jgi:hypothetical protein
MPQPATSVSRRGRITRVTAAIALVATLRSTPSSGGGPQGQAAQAPPPPLTIPYLANATRPADLDFAAAQCDLVSNGEQMACRFRQVFLTTPSTDATSCVITTNGYERIFRRETATHWISESAPDGNCGIVESTTLEDGGGTHWTMTIRTAATLRVNQPECRGALAQPEVYDWRGVKRTLPCTSIQPGAIER